MLGQSWVDTGVHGYDLLPEPPARPSVPTQACWALGESQALDQWGQDEWAMSRTPCFYSLLCAHETVISVSCPCVDILHKWDF